MGDENLKQEKGENKKQPKESFDKVISKIKGAGEDFRKNIKDQEGVLIKTTSASMSILPRDARKHLVMAHKEVVEAGKVMVEDYLQAIDNLLKEVSK